ncbi:MAG: MBL fold metallo-hydrolase [Alphaproteobacteria bacterium]|nr:MBL fold metallo-hydrolase [Alphaproteobacteria bacterium]
MKAFDDGVIRVEDHQDGIWRIEELYASPGGRGAIWVVDGTERRLVLDAGWGLVPLADHVPALFGRPIVAVASHTHFDHIGGLHQFAERWVHPLEAGVLDDPAPEPTQILPYLLDYPESLAFDPMAGGVGGGFDPRAWRIPPAPATGLLDDGGVIDLGGRRLIALHTPGHSPGHLCLYEAARRILFSVDVVYEGEILDAIPGADIDDLLATHRRLDALEVDRVLPGHFGVFDGARMRALTEVYRRSKAV